MAHMNLAAMPSCDPRVELPPEKQAQILPPSTTPQTIFHLRKALEFTRVQRQQLWLPFTTPSIPPICGPHMLFRTGSKNVERANPSFCSVRAAGAVFPQTFIIFLV